MNETRKVRSKRSLKTSKFVDSYMGESNMKMEPIEINGVIYSVPSPVLDLIYGLDDQVKHITAYCNGGSYFAN